MAHVPRTPAGVDVTRPAPARIYDYMLRGSNHFETDVAAAPRILTAVPEIRDCAWSNRGFHQRAAKWIAEQGVRQFIDIGSGLPTAGNTHEIARQVIPDARVVYIDNDPMVLTHGSALLATDEDTAVATADMRHPEEVLGHPQTTRLIDFTRPVGVLLIAMIHFIDLADRPRIMGRLLGALPPGSHVTATHVTTDGHLAEAVAQIERVYATTPTPIHFRGRAEVARFFDGLELADPGLVTIDAWRPDPDDPAPPATRWLYGAVGRKS